MDVEIIETSPLERQIQVAVEASLVDAETDKALNNLKKRVKVKGFRPGKVPRRELNRRYGKSVRNDALQFLIRKTLSDALKKDDLKTVLFVSPPEVVDDSGKGGFSYTFQAEIRPSVEPTGYLGLTVYALDVAVEAEDIDKELESLRAQHAVVEPVEDRAVVEAGDYVTVSYGPQTDDANLTWLKAEEVQIHLTPDAMFPGFFEAVVGSAVDAENEVTITLPEESPAGDMSEVVLNVTVHGIKAEVLPELDDEFAELAGEVDTLAELKTQIENRLTTSMEQQRKEGIKSQLEKRLLKTADFEIPAKFLASRVDDELRHQLNMFRQSGISPEQMGFSIEDMRGRTQERVAERIRLEFVLAAVAERESVKVNENEIDARIEKMTASAGPRGAQLRQYYRDPARRSSLSESLRLDKTLDFLTSKATISTEEPPEDEPNAEDHADQQEAGGVNSAADSDQTGEDIAAAEAAEKVTEDTADVDSEADVS